MNNKILWGIVISIFAISLTFAAWYFIYGGSLTITVNSLGSTKEVNIPFAPMILNTTNASDYSESYMTFSYNKAGNFTVEIIETFADASAGQCVGGESDCKTTYALDAGDYNFKTIVNGQNISVPLNANPKRVSANMTCVAYSCPQTRSINIKLKEY